MTNHPKTYAAILVGGGPAGIAVLLNACRDGILPDLLRQGLLIVERSATLGSGQIGDYVIHSDSTGSTFLDPLRSAREPALHGILETPVAQRIASAGEGAVPLQDVGALMVLIGDVIRGMVREHPKSRIMTRCTAQSATSLVRDHWQVNVLDACGETQIVQTPRLILATGASQPHSRLREERVAGQRVDERWGDRLIQSGQLLSHGGLDKVVARLNARQHPNVAILGGSTSAVAVAHALLYRSRQLSFGERGITIFHRRPLRIYYPTAAEALADGYDGFGPDDVCPISKRVYRFAGLRLDSRELLMQVCGVGGRSPEPRVALHQLVDHDPEAIRQIDGADLVVAAFGYRPNALPLFDDRKRSIKLLAQTGPTAPLVDEECRVLKADGTAVPGVYAIGLAAGYRPRGIFGGEPSFAGQANGLWLWQNGIGSLIARASLGASGAGQGVQTVSRSSMRTRGGVQFAAMGVA